MFTKCNLKCPYCYNYFDQTVSALETHITELNKIAVLADKKTCFVVNGGEPFLLKDLAKLINSVEVQTNIITYTNGLMPRKIYEKFVNEVRKSNLYFTVSIHYAELLRTNNVTKAYKENVKFLIQNIPNLKVNIVFNEDYLSKEFTEEVQDLLLELKDAGLKYINVLLVDELKLDPSKAVKLTSTAHAKNFFNTLNEFEYKHCMWNNRDTSISCLQMWLRKEVMNQVKPYKTVSFLKYKDEYVIEHNFDIESLHLTDNKTTNLDGLIEDLKPLL
jgi:MoaA/NifB/PqqE/SkfB family radical SAM enzyme